MKIYDFCFFWFFWIPRVRGSFPGILGPLKPWKTSKQPEKQKKMGGGISGSPRTGTGTGNLNRYEPEPAWTGTGMNRNRHEPAWTGTGRIAGLSRSLSVSINYLFFYFTQSYLILLNLIWRALMEPWWSSDGALMASIWTRYHTAARAQPPCRPPPCRGARARAPRYGVLSI